VMLSAHANQISHFCDAENSSSEVYNPSASAV